VVGLLITAAGAPTASVVHWVAGFSWGWSALVTTGVIAAWALWGYLRTALKVMWPPLPGKHLPSLHVAQWSGRNFDRLLSKSVIYARHAIAIDENRADFPRLHGAFPGSMGVGQGRPTAFRD
jgi:hypothetical protein